MNESIVVLVLVSCLLTSASMNFWLTVWWSRERREVRKLEKRLSECFNRIRDLDAELWHERTKVTRSEATLHIEGTEEPLEGLRFPRGDLRAKKGRKG